MVFTIQNEHFTFHSFIGGYDKNITYLIQTPETERVWAVDASVPIGEFPGELKNRIAGIFITHTHGDHVAYLDQFIFGYKVTCCMSCAEVLGNKTDVGVIKGKGEFQYG